MEYSNGLLNKVSIGKESTFGSAVTPTITLNLKPSGGLSEELAKNGIEGLTGSLAKNKAFSKGKNTIKGSYDLNAIPNDIGYFIASALGKVVSTLVSGETIVKTHVITEQGAKISYTSEQDIQPSCKRISGVIATGFKIKAKVGSALEITFDLLGKTSADQVTPITAVYNTGRVFSYEDISILKINSVDIKEKVTDFELSYDNGVVYQYGMGGVDSVGYSVNGGSSFKGKINAVLDSVTNGYLAQAKLIDGVPLQLTVIGDTVGVASNYKLDVLAPLIVFNKTDLPLTSNENAVSIDFDSKPDAVNGLVKVELTNTNTSL